MKPKQEEALRDYLRESIVPLIEDVLTKKLGQAITFAKEELAAPVQEPVAWGIIASNTGRICQVELDANEIEGHNPKHIAPLYTTPPAAQRQWVEVEQVKWDGEKFIAKLKEKP
jgi:uncharacterized linocin/CFP29 family protein